MISDHYNSLHTLDTICKYLTCDQNKNLAVAIRSRDICAHSMCTQYVEGINSNLLVTLKSRLRVTQGH